MSEQGYKSAGPSPEPVDYRSRVWGWVCPWSGDENEPSTWTYEVWFWLYKWNQKVRHWFGLHQKPPYYSIAPRCDWCGKRKKP